MRVGVPKEIKVHEYRVGLTPASVAELTAAGHEVVGCTADGHLFVAGLWEHLSDDPRWRVARGDVTAAVEEAFIKGDVGELACDPWSWRSDIEAASRTVPSGAARDGATLLPLEIGGGTDAGADAVQEVRGHGAVDAEHHERAAALRDPAHLRTGDVDARGAELHVVLPFAEEDFLAQSILPGGESWLPRFRTCMAAAASVTHATSIPFFGDPEQYGYASRVAMGLARLFVLTTRTTHWFLKRGFVAATVDDLPRARRDAYDRQRRSQVLIKAL